MAYRSGERVRETTTTTGTGAVTLAGAVTNYQSFASALSDGDQVAYAIVHQSLAEWETGVGTFNSGPGTISRDYVEESSNADAAVGFSAGTKDVFCTLLAAHGLGVPAARVIARNTLIPAGTSLYVTGPLETASGVVVEIGLGATLEIG